MFFTPDTHTYVCVSRGKKRSFFGKFGVLCIFVTSVLRFVLLPNYRQYFHECAWRLHCIPYLDSKQVQRFSVWSFTENVSFISFMEKFGLDIEKSIHLKQAKAYLYRNNRNTLKNVGSKATLPDTHYNNRLNTKVQK